MLTEAQILARKNGIGASESAIILGLSKYCTPYELWSIKTGKMSPPDLSKNEAVWWGIKMEPIIAERYEEETGEKLENKPETVYANDCDFMLCHPDRFVKGKDKIIEIKTARFNSSQWGESGTDQIPAEYVIQVQHQLACVGFEEADLVVYFKNLGKISIYTIKRNEQIISVIKEKIYSFWINNVVADIAPALATISDVEICYPANIIDECIEATENLIQTYAALNEKNHGISQAELICDKYKKILCEYIGESSGLKQGDKILCTWKANKNGQRRFVIKNKGVSNEV